LKRLREKSQNALEVATAIMQDRELQIAARMIVEAVRPLRSEYLDTIEVQRRGPASTAEWQAERASNKWQASCRTILGTLSDWNVLRRFGFRPSHADVAPAQDQQLAIERGRAEAYTTLVMGVVSQRTWSQIPHTTILPDLLTVIFSGDADAVAYRA
jgi:hypothetical protein